jgi:dehydrogenase/reductase SDR family protein 1
MSIGLRSRRSRSREISSDELKPYGVAVVSLYPGLVRTERVMESALYLDLTNSEPPSFNEPAVAADPDVLRHTGNMLVAAGVASEGAMTFVRSC